jgi:predicted glycogen debranching enzyme
VPASRSGTSRSSGTHRPASTPFAQRVANDRHAPHRFARFRVDPQRSGATIPVMSTRTSEYADLVCSLPIPQPPYQYTPASRDPAVLERGEWLLTSGDGGFAMGCVDGVPRRQYHALLIAARTPPVNRVALLNAVEETLVFANEEAIELARYQPPPGSGTPTGPGDAAHFHAFQRDEDCVTWTLKVPTDGDELTLTKTLRLGHQTPLATLRYHVSTTDRPVTLCLTPRVSLRDFHAVLGSNMVDRYTIERVTEQRVRIEADELALVLQSSPNASFEEEATLRADVDYAMTRARGEQGKLTEHLFGPGRFTIDCPANTTTTVALAAAMDPHEPDLELHNQQQRAKHYAKLHETLAHAHPGVDDEVLRHIGPLVRAADDFLVTRVVDDRPLKTVIAGYPWFSDWGRDTMIALPGLMTSCGRYEDALACLTTFARYVDRGMIPNVFDDYGGLPQYNTVDASLWFLSAVHDWSRASGRRPPDVLIDACLAIIEGYSAGTRFHIKVDPEDHLVAAGDEESQLTWMDAKRGGVVFTPRHGKCVEINALWHNGLLTTAQLVAETHPGHATKLRATAELVRESFNYRFQKPNAGLHDCLQRTSDGEWQPRDEVRPNQIIAAALPFSPLDDDAKRRTIDEVRRVLLTPVGLRTLDPMHPKYQPRFKGDMMARDGAYHNGTVWPWLIGPYAEAVLRAGGFSLDAREEAAAAIGTLLEHLDSGQGGCLGSIAEVYDAEEPRDEEGCTAQAWSVAEPLRVMMMILTHK